MNDKEKWLKRKSDLEKRLVPLFANNVVYIKTFGERYEIINGEQIDIHYSREVAEWDRNDLDDFEQKIIKMEAVKKNIDDEAIRNKPLRERREGYKKIDELLFEALAEKENGRPEKMKTYLGLRAKIKKDIPKAKE